MKDFLDRKTLDPFQQEKIMTYQVNYKYIHPTNRNIRSGALAVDSDTSNNARKAAIAELKKDFDHFEITSIKEWTNANK